MAPSNASSQLTPFTMYVDPSDTQASSLRAASGGVVSVSDLVRAAWSRIVA